MPQEIIEKTDELMKAIDNSSLFKNLEQSKKRLLEEELLLSKINKLKTISNKYSNEYITLKKEILEDPIYREYKALENEVYFLTLEINKRLNQLTKKKVCTSESN